MPPSVTRWLPLALLAALALGLRTWDLDRRPMHADEANQAVKTGVLLEHGRYAFDPEDHHGPTLYYAALPVAWLRGESTLVELTETTVRLVPAIAGTAAILLLFLLARSMGYWPAFVAAALLAVSPPAVYYSRYFVQETLLATFTLGALVCGQRWWHSGRLGWAIGAGACAGLMQGSKASAPLLALAVLGGLILARPGKPSSPRRLRDFAWATLAALLVAALLYSSFGTHPRGLLDALLTYPATWSRLGEETGHEKPWWYYLQLFGWQKNGGLVSHQLAFTVPALAGFVVALLGRRPLLRWAAGGTILLLLLLSATAYKTPWHVVHVVPGLAILAAGTLAALPSRATSRFLAAGLALAALLSQAQQVRLTSFQRPADERNPYAYVHSSPDVLKLRALVIAAQARAPGQAVWIMSEESWPLPWYLRGLPDLAYWNRVPEGNFNGELVLASAGLADQVRRQLEGDYQTSFIGLRPGFTLVVFKRQP